MDSIARGPPLATFFGSTEEELWSIHLHSAGNMILNSQNLCEFGIPPNLIDKVILSHCHADHDSGLFQKILHSNVVELITTPTILGSFLRKYSALTGLPTQYFRELFNFRPVCIGSFIDLLGASFRFFYSYHAIPCIGFEVTYCGRSIYFSGDTFYDPEALTKLHHQGVFSKERLESLIDINWSKYDIILHEAGVPPIHTSTAILREFPEHIKERLYLVHIANDALPAGSGLKVAKTGLKNTIILDVKVAIDSTIQKLDLLSSIEFLNEIPLTKARDLIRCSKVESYMPGQVVIKEGTYGNKFYIIMSGIAKIYSSNKLTPFSKYAYASDYFGETSLIQDGKRNAK
jgi:phosphoribosyl 1,2-cyclic phosphodiesterase